MSHQCSRVKVALLLLNNSELSFSMSASASTRATKLADQFRDCTDVGASAEAAADAASTTAHTNECRPFTRLSGCWQRVSCRMDRRAAGFQWVAGSLCSR